MNISILLRHSSVWENDVKYKRYMSDEIVVGDNISFVYLKTAIAVELNVDERKKKLLILYVVEKNSSLITIRNDMGVRLYIEIKKREP